jgi:chromosome segregation ATPase
MTTNTQSPEARLEAVDEEIDELGRRRAEALARISQAEARFEEIEERRAVLSPLTFSGDEQAEQASTELEALEDERDQLGRSVSVARAARTEFERLLAEADKRSSEARKDIHRQHYRAHMVEAERLGSKMDELAAELCELIEKRNSLFHDASQELRFFDQDEANGMTVRGGSRGRDWLKAKFGRWLA